MARVLDCIPRPPGRALRQWGPRTEEDMQAWLVWTLAAAAMVPPAATPAIEGVWSGTLDAGTVRLRLVLHVAARPRGGFAASLDSLDQGATGLPVDEVTLRDRVL